MGDMRPRNGFSTIGQIADAVGVPTSTLRYYEREGLLTPAARSHAGYRLYDPEAVQQLRFIRSAQVVGFSLEHIKALLALDEHTSCRQVQDMIEERLGEITRRIAELRAVQCTLTTALKRCKKSKRGCPVLGDLRGNHRAAARAKKCCDA
jgi:DNA-binding transcriptional MerR regulator